MAKKAKPTTEPVVETLKKETKMSDKTNGILELDMNLEDYEDFEPLPNGEYPGTCILAEKRVSDKGNEYYYTTWQVHPDDFPADYARENAPEGMNLTWARTQVPDPKNRRSITGVKNLLRAMGISLKSSVINPGEWEGKKAKLVLNKSEWNGQEINQISSIEALD